MFATLLQVAFGGAIGACARFLIGNAVAFPFGTLTVNVLGSFLMGVAFVLLTERGLERWILVMMPGILGGFTTFSTFTLDTLRLYETGRTLAAGSYVLASVTLSIVAVFSGVAIMRAAQG